MNCVAIETEPGVWVCKFCKATRKNRDKFPQRNCLKHPEILKAAQQAASQLGLVDSAGKIIEEATHYTQALAEWAAAGFPMRTPEQVKACYEICSQCDQAKPAEEAGWAKRIVAFLGLIGKHVYCGICGCGVGEKRGLLAPNKAVMATQHCPHKSGNKWAGID